MHDLFETNYWYILDCSVLPGYRGVGRGSQHEERVGRSESGREQVRRGVRHVQHDYGSQKTTDRSVNKLSIW